MTAAAYPQPSFCATCLADTHSLRPTHAVTWGGMTCVRWLCVTCYGDGLATLKTFEVMDREASGTVAKGKGGPRS